MDNKVLETKNSATKHDIVVSVRFSSDAYRELQDISVFENEKIAVLCRRLLFEKIQSYERNPIYKRFLKNFHNIQTRKK